MCYPPSVSVVSNKNVFDHELTEQVLFALLWRWPWQKRASKLVAVKYRDVRNRNALSRYTSLILAAVLRILGVSDRAEPPKCSETAVAYLRSWICSCSGLFRSIYLLRVLWFILYLTSKHSQASPFNISWTHQFSFLC